MTISRLVPRRSNLVGEASGRDGIGCGDGLGVWGKAPPLLLLPALKRVGMEPLEGLMSGRRTLGLARVNLDPSWSIMVMG